jgi:hypothetical protein
MLGINTLIYDHLAQGVNRYAPRLDEEEKVKFTLFVWNRWKEEEDWLTLDLAKEWQHYREEEN